MDNDKKLEYARNVFNTLCGMLDSRGFKYEISDDDLSVDFIMGGDDIPMQFIINVDAERQLVRVFSPIPVQFEGDKKLDGAIAVCQANYLTADGSFDYDFNSGRILFRMTSSFIDSLISEDLFEYMVAVSSLAVDEYNDKFLMLSKDKITLEEFFQLTGK